MSARRAAAATASKAASPAAKPSLRRRTPKAKSHEDASEEHSQETPAAAKAPALAAITSVPPSLVVPPEVLQKNAADMRATLASFSTPSYEAANAATAPSSTPNSSQVSVQASQPPPPPPPLLQPSAPSSQASNPPPAAAGAVLSQSSVASQSSHLLTPPPPPSIAPPPSTTSAFAQGPTPPNNEVSTAVPQSQSQQVGPSPVLDEVTSPSQQLYSHPGASSSPSAPVSAALQHEQQQQQVRHDHTLSLTPPPTQNPAAQRRKGTIIPLLHCFLKRKYTGDKHTYAVPDFLTKKDNRNKSGFPPEFEVRFLLVF